MLKDSLSYSLKSHFNLTDKIVCSIPDGYRKGADESWSFVVPEQTSNVLDHIDAKPFSFAVTTNPIATLSVNDTLVDHVISIFKLRGYLQLGVEINKVVVDPNCIYLYQGFIDPTDSTYNKANGFLLTASGIHQFHAYYNHGGEIDACDEDVQNEFYKIVEEWMKQTVYFSNVEDDNGVVASVSSRGETTVRYSSSHEEDTEAFEIENGVLTAYRGNSAEVVIPDGVEKIAQKAFYYSMGIESVVIPASVIEIGEEAFSYCKFLKKVFVPKSVERIQNSAFYGDAALTIYCEVAEKPDKWDENWNWLHWSDYCPVVWGHKFD